ncbi:hypothetical protein KSP40_PGU009934 [Platanthera guangdongensis]|uniref:Uncharacterized protein n=1 Tax=Platanthera guangdongensis TaxID=2320717 RepID=A0ABR2LUD0_9ASPA
MQELLQPRADRQFQPAKITATAVEAAPSTPPPAAAAHNPIAGGVDPSAVVIRRRWPAPIPAPAAHGVSSSSADRPTQGFVAALLSSQIQLRCEPPHHSVASPRSPSSRSSAPILFPCLFYAVRSEKSKATNQENSLDADLKRKQPLEESETPALNKFHKAGTPGSSKKPPSQHPSSSSSQNKREKMDWNLLRRQEAQKKRT